MRALVGLFFAGLTALVWAQPARAQESAGSDTTVGGDPAWKEAGFDELQGMLFLYRSDEFIAALLQDVARQYPGQEIPPEVRQFFIAVLNILNAFIDRVEIPLFEDVLLKGDPPRGDPRALAWGQDDKKALQDKVDALKKTVAQIQLMVTEEKAKLTALAAEKERRAAVAKNDEDAAKAAKAKRDKAIEEYNKLLADKGDIEAQIKKFFPALSDDEVKARLKTTLENMNAALAKKLESLTDDALADATKAQEALVKSLEEDLKKKKEELEKAQAELDKK